MKTFAYLLFSIGIGLVSVACTQNKANSESSVISGQPRLEITVDYEKQSGRGSNQYAVWIEDPEGALVRTLFVTRFTAKGGYSYRPDCTPLWVGKANPSSMAKEKADAFTGATPKSGSHTYTWDLKDDNGNNVAPGPYTFVVEGTLLGPSEVIFRSTIEIGGSSSMVEATPEYTSDSPDNKGMIKAVKASYFPE